MHDPMTVPLETLLKPAVEAVGYTWWGCQFDSHFLRVYIDKPGGVNVEDCARASHHLKAVLSVHSPIRREYTLEVSSPGLDRPLFTLAQYEQFKGHKIKLRLSVAQEGQRNFQGVIESIEKIKREITVQAEGKEKKTFRFDDIAQANLVPDFGD